MGGGVNILSNISEVVVTKVRFISLWRCILLVLSSANSYFEVLEKLLETG